MKKAGVKKPIFCQSKTGRCHLIQERDNKIYPDLNDLNCNSNSNKSLSLSEGYNLFVRGKEQWEGRKKEGKEKDRMKEIHQSRKADTN